MGLVCEIKLQRWCWCIQLGWDCVAHLVVHKEMHSRWQKSMWTPAHHTCMFILKPWALLENLFSFCSYHSFNSFGKVSVDVGTLDLHGSCWDLLPFSIREVRDITQFLIQFIPKVFTGVLCRSVKFFHTITLKEYTWLYTWFSAPVSNG